MTIKLNLKRSKKKITPYGGTVVLKKAIDVLNIRNKVDNLILSGKSNRAKKPSCFIIPAIVMLHTGGTYLTDLDRMREDETLQLIHNITSIPHSTTMGAWCKRHGGNSGLDIPKSDTIKHLEKINSSIALQGIRAERLKEVTLDIDATMIKAEKEESNFTYKKFRGMSSLMGFISDTGYVIGEEFRNGNISPSSRNYEFMLHCINNIENSNNVKVTTFRSDSAGYQGKIIDYCIDSDIRFYIGGVMNNPVAKAISLIPSDNWKPFTNKDGSKLNNHYVSSFTHTMQENKYGFRIVVEKKPISEEPSALYKAGNYTYKLIATNSTEDEVKVIQAYNKRGTCENFIKEAKYGFSLKYLPCGTVRGNAVWFKIGMLSYNIGIYIKRNILKDKFFNKLIKTIRYQLYNIPGQIVKHSGKLTLKLFCSADRFNLFPNYLDGNYLEI
jgi:hypothetical protein